jgi:hypothetical protein
LGSLADDAEALNFIDNISCHRLNMALRTICIDDMGKEAVRDGLKMIKLKNVKDKSAMKMTFEGGVLEMHCAYALRDRRHARRQRDQGPASQEALERSLKMGYVPFFKFHWLPVSGELEVAAPGLAAVAQSAHSALPVDRSGARARVELLIVHQRLQDVAFSGGRDAHRHRVFDTGAR